MNMRRTTDAFLRRRVSLQVKLVAILMISRLPVYSGKTVGKRISKDRVIPLIFGLVFYVLLLVIYPWQTLSVSVVAYLLFLPLSARAYSRRADAEEAMARAAAAEQPPQ